jgi:hypothetical protein
LHTEKYTACPMTLSATALGWRKPMASSGNWTPPVTTGRSTV